ncbi:MAG: peptidylprolyl isomerase [Planctomycetes bacterium]|nr:peptidylprolyl isomerase [Planctomycetota bacterium]
MEGTQAPSQIEYLYERYRHLLKWVLALVIVGFGIDYFFKWQHQQAVDSTWSGFAAITGMEDSYTDKDGVYQSLTDHLSSKDLTELEAALAQANEVQKPFLLLAVARRAMIDRNWERAESSLSELESKYPNHSLVTKTDYPIQVRDEVKEDKKDKPDKKPRPKTPEYKPAKPGSLISLMREQIAAAKVYTRPAQFSEKPIPADAPKVKFELSGDYGSFTIALMEKEAPLHAAKFLELAKAGFWKDLNIDEIQRAGTGYFKNPMQFHLGWTTTKEPDRSKWTKTEPSENQVEFEESDLSHFPGAVAAREEADGKSCADRFYVCGEDCADKDGSRVVFGYVVDGLETVKNVCEAAMTAQEADAGKGVPEDNITVVSVTVLE